MNEIHQMWRMGIKKGINVGLVSIRIRSVLDIAYRKMVTVEEVMNSMPVVTPLKMLDCCANADGAIVMTLASRGVAKKGNG